MEPNYKYLLLILFLMILGGFLTLNSSMPKTPVNVANKLGFQ